VKGEAMGTGDKGELGVARGNVQGEWCGFEAAL